MYDVQAWSMALFKHEIWHYTSMMYGIVILHEARRSRPLPTWPFYYFIVIWLISPSIQPARMCCPWACTQQTPSAYCFQQLLNMLNKAGVCRINLNLQKPVDHQWLSTRQVYTDWNKHSWPHGHCTQHILHDTSRNKLSIVALEQLCCIVWRWIFVKAWCKVHVQTDCPTTPPQNMACVWLAT